MYNIYLRTVKNREIEGKILNKKEIMEIKKRMKKESCTFTRMCGCYVDSSRNRVTRLGKTFLNLDEEEFYKYLDVAKKVLSGTIGNNLMELEFPLAEEEQGGRQQFLLGLRESKLKNEDLLERFYDLIIENYCYAGNYLILIFHDAYDIPLKTKDHRNLDESEEIYEYLLCAICPVTLSKPGLGYLENSNEIGLRLRDWIVGAPDVGFVFPAFTDRSTDIHAALFYTKNVKESPAEFMESVFGCNQKMTATEQKDIFRSILEDALGDESRYETIKEIHDKIHEKISENAESSPKNEEPEPIELSKSAIREILNESGISEEKVCQAEQEYDKKVGEAKLYAENVVDQRKFEVKTYDVVLHVKPEKAARIKSQIIDGQKCLIIPMDANENINVNGIHTTV